MILEIVRSSCKEMIVNSFWTVVTFVSSFLSSLWPDINRLLHSEIYLLCYINQNDDQCLPNMCKYSIL